MATNFLGSVYDERTNGDFSHSSDPDPRYAFGKNVTIYGTLGASDPHRYSTDEFHWQDNIPFDLNTRIYENDPQHPNPLVAGRTYDIEVVVYNFGHVDLKFENNSRAFATESADNYGGSFTWPLSYTPSNSSGSFTIVLQARGQSPNGNVSPAYKITVTERPVPLPDLVGKLTQLKSDTVEHDGRITVVYELTNTGNQPTSIGNFDTYLSKDPTITTSDIYLGTLTSGTIAPGEAQIFEVTSLSLPDGVVSGEYFVGLIADAANKIEEIDENNNVSTQALPVFVKPSLDAAVRAVYHRMYAGDLAGDKADILESFADAQYSYGRQIGVYSPFVYANEALGLALAERAGNGSTAFAQNYGPATLTSNQLFTRKAYSDIFGRDPTSEQAQHFLKQVEYFENLYEKSGAYGADETRIEQLARGAVFGQMVGVKAEAAGSTTSQLLAEYDFF